MLRRVATAFKIILLSLILGPLLILAVQNSQPVALTMHPLAYELTLPLFLFIILAFMAGIACCGITLNLKQLGLKREAARLKRRAEALENELAGIKHEVRYQSAMTAPPVVPAP